MTNETSNSRVRSRAGSVLIALPGVAVILSETMKFLHVPAVVQQMAAAGFSEGKLLLVATLGMASAVLFLYPRTRSGGVLLFSSFLGGAICIHVQRGEYAMAAAPLTLLALAWVGTYLRHPEMLWSLGRSTFHASEASGRDWASREV